MSVFLVEHSWELKNSLFFSQHCLQVLDFSNAKGAAFSIAEEEKRGYLGYYCGLQRDTLVSKYLQVNLSC